MLAFATRTTATAATTPAATATAALARRIIAVVRRHCRRHGRTRCRCRTALFTRGALLAARGGLACHTLLARGPLLASRTLVASAAAATLLASGSLGTRGVLFTRCGLLVTTAARRRTLAASVAAAVRTGAATATAALRGTAATSAAVLAFHRFLDRPARAACNAHPERTRADPQEPALALFDRGDHRFGARQSQRLQALADRFIETLAFIDRTSHCIAPAGRACVARSSAARER